jgi:addiction module HigA family antidote
MATKSLRDPSRRPTHPGAILREDVLPALGMTQKEFAERLGVSRLTVSELLHEKRAVTADMAMRLGRLLGNGPEIWLRMQQTLDLWELAQRGGYEGIQTLKAA